MESYRTGKDGEIEFLNPKTNRYLRVFTKSSNGKIKKSSSYYRILKQQDIKTYETFLKESEKKYVINVRFSTITENNEKPYYFNKSFNITTNPQFIKNKSFKEKTVKQLVNKHIEKMNSSFTERRSSADLELYDIDFNTLKIRTLDEVNLKKIKNKKISLLYNFLDKNVQKLSYGQNNICVLDYIYSELCGKDKYQSLTIEKLKQDFKDWENGISVEEIVEWAKMRKNISVYALNPFKNVFESYVCEKKNAMTYALVFIINNNHCYGVFDENMRQQVFKNKKIDLSEYKFIFSDDEDYDVFDFNNDKYDDLMNETFSEKKVILLDAPEPVVQDLMNSIIKKYDTMIDNISFDACNRILAFENPISKQIYLYSPDYKIRKNIMETLYEKKNIQELRFRNQSYQEITKLIHKYFFNKEPCLNEYNDKVLDIIDTYRPKPLQYALTDDNKNCKDSYAFDLKKSYSKFLRDNEYNYPIFTICDEVKPFDINEEITEGLYYVDKTIYLTTCKSLFLEKGFYTHMTIDKCIKRGVISKEDVKYCVKAGHFHKNDYFKDVVEFVYETFTIKDAKMLINSFTGCFNMKYNTENYAAITDSWEVVLGCIDEENKKGRECKATFLNDYYFIRSKSKTRKLKDLCPIYNMIIEGGIWNLVDMYDEIYEDGISKITYVKTDCIGVINPKRDAFEKIDDNVIIGGFKTETYKIKGKKPVFTNEEYVHEPYEWIRHEERDNYDEFLNQLQDLKSFFIQGDGGAGKSYTAIQFMKQNPDLNFEVLAFTNKAVCGLKEKGAIQARTIDSLFYDEFNKKVDYISKLRGTDYIIIDEYSMIPLTSISKFLQIKKILKCKFIVLGDDKQIKPVNSDNRKLYNYKESYVFKYLCDNNFIEMKYKPSVGRYDEETYKILCEFTKTGIIPECLKHKELKKNLMTNICYYKKTCERVNNQCRELFLKNNKNAIMINEIFSVGMKVISNKNFKNKEVYNSEIYTITDFKDDIVFIKNDRNEAELNKATFVNKFMLGYAITAHRFQGDTIKEEYNIYDIERMSKEILYTSFSRCKPSIKNVHFKYTDKVFENEEITNEAVLLDGLVKDFINGSIYGIYEVECIEDYFTEKLIYIGQTIRTVEERFKEHIESEEDNKFHIYLRENKDKIFTYKTLANCLTEKVLHNEEQRLIKTNKDLLNTMHNIHITKESKFDIKNEENYNRILNLKSKEKEGMFKWLHDTKNMELKFMYNKKMYSKRYKTIGYEAARLYLESIKNDILEKL